MAVEITLDIFSGRPNPTWSLSGAGEQELRSRFLSLPVAADRAVPQPPGLGYRGFVLDFGRVGGAAGQVTVYRGAVSHPGGVYEDIGRELEKWLLDTAGTALDESLKSLVRAELARA